MGRPLRELYAKCIPHTIELEPIHRFHPDKFGQALCDPRLHLDVEHLITERPAENYCKNCAKKEANFRTLN
jgi:hypothetical protein